MGPTLLDLASLPEITVRQETQHMGLLDHDCTELWIFLDMCVVARRSDGEGELARRRN